MATQMASTRQPFAPLNSSRLQNLTSLKNRQNALTTLTSPSKRKATTFEHDTSDVSNSENIDPILFLSPKRSKHPDGSHTSKDASLCKPSPTNYFLTRAPPSPNEFSSVKQTGTSTASRPMLNARSPAKSRLDTTSRSTPLSAPAGRSPTRKRIGILNRRKTGSPFTRVDPPRFSTSSSSTSSVGFSIDAALSGTIPSYTSRQAPAAATPTPASASIPVQAQAQVGELPIPVLHQDVAKDSWFFEIHEDTEEELATNLMEHGACTLDISSDEESAARERDARGKENVPPMDDVSQTRTVLDTSSSSSSTAEASMADIKARLHRASRRGVRDENAIEVDRAPLGDLAAEDFYGEEVEVDADASEGEVGVAKTFDFVAEVVGKGKGIEVDVRAEALMGNLECAEASVSGNARLLEPIEKVEEGWSVWESGSAKGDE
ncbi:hypothetical protein BKA65DRAFT_76054 [Rhexocercosporidium sp. MPI-PUGE-AT-0058]|nr:hypothetical protein BKA65DRAFT_76054 [Rhexocercosporidium sp. MPI-PUGE-AT-0058]